MALIPGASGSPAKAVDGIEGATSGAPVAFPSGFQGSQIPTTLADADFTMTAATNSVVVMTPTATRTITLPSTGIPANYSITVINRSASFSILVNSSGGNLVATVGLGQVTVLSTIASPTTAGHWSISTNGAALQGGNSFGTAMLIGTNDNFGLNLETNGTPRVSISAAGIISGTASHLGNGGLVPVGSIIAYNPGYYTNTANAGFTTVGPAGNTVAQINTFLNTQGWYVCDGAAVNVAASPIWNAASRNLPNLSDSRFLMGSTTAGTAAGANSITLIAANIPQLTSSSTSTSADGGHSHTAGTLAQTLTGSTSFAAATHDHNMAHSHQWGRVASGSNVLRFWNSASGSNTSVNSDAYGNSQFPSVNYANSPSAGSIVDFFATRQPMYTSGVSAGPNGTDGSARTGADNASSSVGISAMTGSTAAVGTHTHTVTISVGNASPTAISVLPQYLSTYFIIRVF